MAETAQDTITPQQENPPPQLEQPIVSATVAEVATPVNATEVSSVPKEQDGAIKEPEQKKEAISSLVDRNLVSADQSSVLEQVPAKKVQLISQLLENKSFTGNDVELLIYMSEEDLASNLDHTKRESMLKNAAIDQLIQDGVFTKEDRETLKTLKLDALQTHLAEYQENPQVAARLADIERKEQDLPPLYKVTQESLLESADQEIQRQELAYLRTGGKLDTALGKIMLPDAIKEVYVKIEAEFKNEAHTEYAKSSKMTPAELAATPYTDSSNNLLSEDEFIGAYILNKKDPKKNPGIEERITIQVQEALQKKINELRGKTPLNEEDAKKVAVEGESSEAVKELKKSLVEKMIAAGMVAAGEAGTNLLNMDFMTLFRLLVHGASGAEMGRGGSLGFDTNGNLIRNVGEDELFNAFKKPQELSQALAMALSRSKEMQDAGFTADQDVIDKALEGDPRATRELVQALVTHLHEKGASEEMWQVLSKGVAEGLYPGVNAQLDSKVHDIFMKDKGAEVLRLLDIMMPKTAQPANPVASQSVATITSLPQQGSADVTEAKAA